VTTVPPPAPEPQAGPARPAQSGKAQDRPARVAFLAGTASGGTAAHLASLAAGCRDAGLEVIALGPSPDQFGPGVKFETVAVGHRPRAGDAAAILRLRRRLRAWQPDIVHAHGVRAGGFAALALLGCSVRSPGAAPWRCALVVTVHNAPPPGHLSRLGYLVLERVCARRADEVLCASRDLASRMRELGAARVAQVDVAAAAAEPSAEAVARVRAEIGAGDRPVVLSAGRLTAQKGFDVLVAAAARWRDRDPAPLTVIAGDGPLAAGLRAQASRVGADVLLLGHRDDVPALMAVADVVAVPSRWEARALVVQEAMRAGRPVVATRVGGTTELTGADTALLIPPDDPAALAAAVMTVLDDPPLAAGLARAAAARSGAFPTEGETVRRAVALYRRLAGAQG
jgi:glycosyltransferase involved in cell wall biosynthesis